MWPIQWRDCTLPSPAENLACDEALLDQAEANGGPGVLRFWESPEPFVVVGYANQVTREVDLDECARRKIGIYRRCSGGGSVLQGPGCLNYALVLPLKADAALQSITGTNRFIMERHCSAMATLLGRPVSVAGSTDLVLGDRKFSGNSQRRRREWLLFHGTFLLQMDLPLMRSVLREPARQPDYRKGRAHEAFLTCVEVRPEALKQALRVAWNSADRLEELPFGAVAKLVTEKYRRDAWIYRGSRG